MRKLLVYISILSIFFLPFSAGAHPHPKKKKQATEKSLTYKKKKKRSSKKKNTYQPSQFEKDVDRFFTDLGNFFLAPFITVYSPQKGGHSMEGGHHSSRPGLGQNRRNWRTWKVKTMEEYDPSDPNSYVTLAGHPKQYYRKYTIDRVRYKTPSGRIKEFRNVRAYVHDTGAAFRSAKAAKGGKFDVPLAKDWNPSFLNRALLSRNMKFKPGWIR